MRWACVTQVFINSIIIMAPGKVFVFAWVPCNKVHSFTHHWNSSLNFQVCCPSANEQTQTSYKKANEQESNWILMPSHLGRSYDQGKTN